MLPLGAAVTKVIETLGTRIRKERKYERFISKWPRQGHFPNFFASIVINGLNKWKVQLESRAWVVFFFKQNLLLWIKHVNCTTDSSLVTITHRIAISYNPTWPESRFIRVCIGGRSGRKISFSFVSTIVLRKGWEIGKIPLALIISDLRLQLLIQERSLSHDPRTRGGPRFFKSPRILVKSKKGYLSTSFDSIIDIHFQF